jgi:hypothetical protein
MQTEFAFFASIAFSLIAWGMVAARYIWPRLRIRQRAEALRPLLTLHSFRFVGLSFLVPGVVSPDLPSAFAHSALWRHHCGDPRFACADIAAQCIRRCHSMDLQYLGYSRSFQCFLPGQSRRAHRGAVGRHLFHSDFHRAPTADHARTRFPDSYAASASTRNSRKPAPGVIGQTVRSYGGSK